MPIAFVFTQKSIWVDKYKIFKKKSLVYFGQLQAKSSNLSLN